MVRRQCILTAWAMILLLAASGGYGSLRSADNDDPGDLYTLEKLESIVTLNDAGVRAFLEKIRETRAQLSETRFRYGPDFTSYYSRYPSGGSLTEEEENVQHWLSVGIRQDLIEFLKIRPGRIDAMESRLDGAEAALDEARNAAILELRRLYVGISATSAIAEFQADRVEIYSRMFDIESTRYAHLTTLLPDLLYAQKELVTAEDELDYQTNELKRRKDFLARLAGIRPEQLVIERLPIPVVLPAEERLIEMAMERRGDIRQFDANARVERANASTAAYDDIRLSAFVGYRVRDSRLSGSDSGIGFNVTFTMPFLFWNLRDSRMDRFLAREKSYLFEAEKERRDITREIRATYSDYSRLHHRYDAAMRDVGLVAEKLRIEEARLENPVGSFESDPVSVLKIESELMLKEMEKEMIRSRLLETYYELLFQAGLSDPGLLVPEPDSEPPIYARDPALRSNMVFRQKTVAMEQAPYWVNGEWMIQVASYTRIDHANAFVDLLNDRQYKAFISESQHNDITYFRVRVGYFSSRDAAVAAGREITATYGLPDVWIIAPASDKHTPI